MTKALFADLNRGGDVTKGLKKVTDDMKTHKNTALRRQAPVKASASTGKNSFIAANQQEVKKAPKFELEGKRWNVEYQDGNKNICIDDTDMKQTVYIFKCFNSLIQVNGKVNSIILDSCKKCAVVFDDVIASIEYVNCQSVQGQVRGKVPTIAIEKTDGCQMYLSEDSKEAQIITAKSSEMNILIPGADGEYKEFAVVEQFRTYFNGTKLVTEPTDIVA